MAGIAWCVTLPHSGHSLGCLSKNNFIAAQVAPKATTLNNKVQASQIKLKYKNTSSSSPLRYLLRNRPGIKNKKAHTTEAVFMNQLLQTEKFLPICVADNRREINLI